MFLNKICKENVNSKKLVDNLWRNISIRRKNTEKTDMKTKELKEKVEELDTKVGKGSQIEAKNLLKKYGYQSKGCIKDKGNS